MPSPSVRGAGLRAACAAFVLATAALASNGCVERIEYQPPPGFELSMPVPQLVARQGEWLTVPVEVRREPDLRGPIALEVRSLPLGFTARPAEIPEGESRGEVQLLPEDAPVGEELTLVIRGRAGEGVASAVGTLLVMGRVSEYHSGGLLELPRGSVVVKEGLPGGGVAFVIPATLELLRVGPTGLPMPGFGHRGDGRVSFASVVAGRRLTALVSSAVQPDGKLVVAVGYTSADPGDAAGTLLFRVLPDGRLDHGYGEDGAVRWRGLEPSAMASGASPGGITTVVQGRKAEGVHLAQFSEAGVLLQERKVSPTASFADLVVQPDGKVVAVEAQRLVRFRADLTPDPEFGTDGELVLGVYLNHVAALSDGFLVGGEAAVARDPYPYEPRIWRFDAQWRPAPGFGLEGQPCGDRRAHHFRAAFEDGGEIYSAVAGELWDDLVGHRRDGTINLELGAPWSRPGAVTLWPRYWNEYVVALVPHPPRRALAVRRTETFGVVTFQLAGVWY